MCHLKMIIDAIIRGYTLHTLFGWNMILLAALFSSTTHLLMHLSRNSDEESAYTLTPVEETKTHSQDSQPFTTLNEKPDLPAKRLPPLRL